VQVDAADHHVLEYSGIEEFRIVNPGCCQVEGDLGGEGPPHDITLLKRVLGIEYSWVAVRWKTRIQFDDGRREELQKKRYVYLDQCGNDVGD
jgi:hypothetical protein